MSELKGREIVKETNSFGSGVCDTPWKSKEGIPVK